MVSITGKFELYEVDTVQMDEYLRRCGVGLVLRKVLTAVSTKPTLKIDYLPDTDEWSMIQETPFKTWSCRFKLGQSFQNETLDARQCTAISEIIDGKFVIHQSCEEGPDVRVIHEKLGENILKLTMSVDDFSVSQTFIKVD